MPIVSRNLHTKYDPYRTYVRQRSYKGFTLIAMATKFPWQPGKRLMPIVPVPNMNSMQCKTN